MCTRSSILRRNVSWHTEHVKTWQCEGQAGPASAGASASTTASAGASTRCWEESARGGGGGALGWERATRNLLALMLTLAERCKPTTPGWGPGRGQGRSLQVTGL